jgi:predicted MFS family arabinose efflux permease
MHRFGVGRSFVWMLASLPVLLFVYVLSNSILWAVVVIVPLSAAHSIVLSLAIAFMQQYSPDQIRGRILGIHRSVTVTSYALASSVLGLVAHQIGLRLTLGTAAVALAAFLVWSYFNRHGGLHEIAALDRRKPESDEIPPEEEGFLLENSANGD